MTVGLTNITEPERRGNSPRRTIMVVANGAIHPLTGAGQRTALFCEAMAEVAPLTVIILGGDPNRKAGEFFPSAATVIGLPVREFFLAKRFSLRWAESLLRRLFLPSSIFAVSPAVSHALAEALGDYRNSFVAFRYLRTFASSGLSSDEASEVRCAVDIDDRDDLKIESQLHQRLGRRLGHFAYRLLRPRITRAIDLCLDRADLVWLAKSQDRFAFDTLDQRVIPNVPAHTPGPEDLVSAREGRCLLFVGTPAHLPNANGLHWFLANCWGPVKKICPDATVRIVGFGDWSALSARWAATPGVEVVGPVQDLAPVYRTARAVIAPIFEGAGSQTKLIEACSYARPVVASSLAARGFGSEIADRLVIADDSKGFAAACITMLTEPEAASDTGWALHRLQRSLFSKAAMKERIRTDIASLWDLEAPSLRQAPC